MSTQLSKFLIQSLEPSVREYVRDLESQIEQLQKEKTKFECKDKSKKCEITAQSRSVAKRDWEVVRKLCAGSPQYFLPSGAIINESTQEDFYNVPFLLAYGVLEQALTKLIEHKPEKNKTLFCRMETSKNHLTWQNYAVVDAGRIARNDLAHKAKLLGQAECFAYIDAIEAELKAWGVL